MGDKKQIQKQIDKLVVMVNELEKRELAVNRESKHLEELKLKLDEQERSIAESKAAAPARELPVREIPAQETEKPNPVFREKPLAAPQPALQNASRPAPPPEQTPASPPPAAPVAPSDAIVAEINTVLKSIFWDYSASVQQISSQISTVTAATMCAAVTCLLENRSFDAKDVFLQEIHKMLQSGALSAPDGKPPVKNSQPESKPVYTSEPVFRPAPAPAVQRPVAEPVSRLVPVPAAAPVSRLTPKPAPEPVPIPPAPDTKDEPSEAQAPEQAAPAKAEPAGDDVLRIGSVIEFQKLGEYGFRNDEKIVRIALPEGIQYLPGNFFYGCSNLREIWLPNSLLEIGSHSFYGCKSLTAVHIGEQSSLMEIGEYAFAMCEALTAFTVPSLVETLGTSVFRFCSALESVTFAGNSRLHAIGSHLLQNCTSLEKITLPDSVTVIPTSMFYGCTNLRKVVARGVDTIEDYAFLGNESLRTVRIRAKKTIAAQAFEGCDPALVVEYLNY